MHPTDAPPSVDTRSYLRSALRALAIGFVGLLTWAALAPLDEGVPAQGIVAIDNKRKPIQHLQGGIVREVLVREGAWVEEGQVLVVLESATAKANLESIRQHYLSLRASESRLMAELSHQPEIRFHTDLQARASDPLVQQHVLANQHLFRARRSALQANVLALQQQQEAALAQQRGLTGSLQEKGLQLDLLAQQLERLEPLVREGYAPVVQQLELEKNMADLRAQLEDMRSSRQRALHQADELGHKVRVLQQEYVRESSQALADIHRELLADQEKLVALTQDLQRTEIRSPAQGQVVGLAAVSTGSVASPGQKLMDIVPAHPELIIEARLQPHVIDRISPHQKADIRFSAFSHSPLLVVEGQVESVSNDLVNDAELKQLFYLARISLTSEGMNTLAHRELQAGLPAEVLIKTGSRSLLSYLAYPLVRRLHKTFREE